MPEPIALVSLTIVRYRKQYIFFAILAMAIHRIPLWMNRSLTFRKLMGCGKDGGFSKRPDWQQWGILTVTSEPIQHTDDLHTLLKNLYGGFIAGWYRVLSCKIWTVLLEPIEGHGAWDGKMPFGELNTQSAYEGRIAVLTRATIRLNRLKNFWANVDGVTRQMSTAPGLITSVSIGEVPFIKQATFSIWKSKADMKAFAYGMQQHTAVIKKTRDEKWYSEELFVRFKVLAEYSTLNENKATVKTS